MTNPASRPLICKTFEEFCNKYKITVYSRSEQLLEVFEENADEPYFIPSGLSLKQFELVRSEYQRHYRKGLYHGVKKVQSSIKDALGIDQLNSQDKVNNEIKQYGYSKYNND